MHAVLRYTVGVPDAYLLEVVPDGATVSVGYRHPSAHQPALQRALEEAAGGPAPGEPDRGRVLLPGAGLAAFVPGDLSDGDGLE